MADGTKISSIDAVPDDGTLLFSMRDGTESVEAILVRDGAEIRAWRNRCQHWTDVRFDTGSGAEVRDGELVCRKHGAMFEIATGGCTFGPCEGARLEPIEIAVEDGEIRLVDDRYAFEELDPTPDRDRSTRGGLGF